jgi:hypothetical protein
VSEERIGDLAGGGPTGAPSIGGAGPPAPRRGDRAQAGGTKAVAWQRTRLLTREEAARYLGIPVRTLDKLSPRIKPQIAYVRLSDGSDKRYPIELLDGYIDRLIDKQVQRQLLPIAA